MSMASIRKHYHVPACRGGLVKFQGEEARITSADRTNEWLHLRSVKTGSRWVVHPTYEMQYILCDEEDGDLKPCERPAMGYRIDTDFGERYPVCKEHHVPPFERCAWRWGATAADTRCKVHGGAQADDSNWCDKAFEATP